MASSLRLVVRLLTYLAVANAASQPHIVYFLVDDLGYEPLIGTAASTLLETQSVEVIVFNQNPDMLVPSPDKSALNLGQKILLQTKSHYYETRWSCINQKSCRCRGILEGRQRR